MKVVLNRQIGAWLGAASVGERAVASPGTCGLDVSQRRFRRREFIATIAGAAAWARRGRVQAQARSFDDLLKALQTDAELVDAMRTKSSDATEVGLERAPLRAPKSNTPISQRASELIVACEVSGKALYEARYRSPTWPRGQSGITIGIGYDIGYVTPQQLGGDWTAYVAAQAIELLAEACGVTGLRANAVLAQLQGHVDIGWSTALRQFEQELRPRYVGETEKALPNSERLNADCLGALVSLVYNRGASFGIEGDRYKEMRAIKAHMAQRAFDRIPAEIRAMEHLWRDDPSMRGVVLRREAEAALFEIGMKAMRP
jgi:GH24 family phage-related lysozyme (muramidase)